MDAATLIANIRSQALVGNTGASDDIDRILRYLNNGYNMVYAEIAQLIPTLYRRSQNIPITEGVGLYIFPVFKLLSVRDRNNSFSELVEGSIDDIELSDAGLNAVGNPTTYDKIFNGLVTYPRNTTVLQLWYVPPPVPLTPDTREIDIQIPPAFHEVLQWAALYTMAYDERDKLVGAELQFTKNSYDTLMESLKLHLFSQIPREQRRVKAW
ncbi:hypothetical protein ELG64_09035 [Rhizobium leguminosarum]|uniref:phage adaptor protein n=1 Tax=Rhizobium leguminosarum TaxID=384 RepID=UPI001031D107|nr:hypothetical protein [Rhizobium leguminosarum]TBH23638.1 hypothetical protein ELG64_09035 [Rhizobium leguminosarum]